jgi:DNA-binding transcriptional ArsR family regulator
MVFTEKNLMDCKAVALVLRAVSHKLRLSILEHLRENGKRSVTELVQALRIEQSVVSQHLAILRKQNIVFTQRVGKKRYYDVDNGTVLKINKLVGNVAAQLAAV